MKFVCDKCKHEGELKDIPIKMGGLLCSKCRTVLFQPYVDKKYFQELERRRKEEKEES